MKHLKLENLDRIILHCTDTESKMCFDVPWIRAIHINKGFEDIGYHFVIMPNGEICTGRSLLYEGAHCLGVNHRSIGIAYVGGRIGCSNCDTRTILQKLSIMQCITNLCRDFPQIELLQGHNEHSTKFCPCFDVQKVYGDWFVNMRNELKTFQFK